MKIISGKIDWMEGCGNDPHISVLVDKIPPMNDFRFQKRGDLYFAHLEGYARFFCWHGRPDTGFGGSHFNLTMEDGSEVELIGPWSSGSYAMNAAGFPHSIEVDVIVNNSKYGQVGGHMLISKVLEAMDQGVIECSPYMEGKDFFGSKVGTPIPFPEGSKLILEQEGEEAGGSLVTDMSGEQTNVLRGISARTIGLSYVVAVQLPDGTIWRKRDYIEKESE